MKLHLTNYRLFEIIGRILIAALYLPSGFGKITGFAGSVAYAKAGAFPMSLIPNGMFSLAVCAAIVIEIIIVLLFVIGFKLRWMVVILAIYTLVASFGYHSYWLADSSMAYVQKLLFFKNIAVVGGLLCIFANVRDGK